MRHRFAGFWMHPHDCAGRHGRRHGFAGILGGVLGHGDFDWHSFRAGRKLGAEDLQLVILALLAEKPAHGYEIIKALSERSGGYYHPSPGMVYPALTYLEEIGYASVEAEGTRKPYNITVAGRAHLDENRGAAETMLAQLKWVRRKDGACAQRVFERRRFERQDVGEAQSGPRAASCSADRERGRLGR